MDKVKKIIGWSLVVLGAIIFIMGGAHEWYEETVVHEGWNKFVMSTGLPSELMGEEHEDEGPGDFIPEEIAPWLLLALIAVPIVWYYYNKRKQGGENG